MCSRSWNLAPGIFGIAALGFITACGGPVDPERTGKRIASTKLLRAGVSANPPAVVTGSGEPQGIEPDLIRGFARTIGARVQWSEGNETALAGALEHHRLDIVAGGFDKSTIWASRVGVSHPYAARSDGGQPVLLVAPGENGFLLALDRYLISQREWGLRSRP